MANEMKKYELTDETILLDNRTLHRIRAVVDFGYVKQGDLGGFVEFEENLAQDGDCAWLYDNACAFGNARVYGDAYVRGNAHIFGNAHVFGYAQILNNARIFGNARVFEHALVSENSYVFEDARVCGDARVCSNAWLYGDTCVFGRALVGCDTRLCGGEWDRSPLFIQAKNYSFNVASNVLVRVGEQFHTWQEWSTHYEDIYKEYFANDAVAEFAKYFNFACTLYGHEDCIIEDCIIKAEVRRMRKYDR